MNCDQYMTVIISMNAAFRRDCLNYSVYCLCLTMVNICEWMFVEFPTRARDRLSSVTNSLKVLNAVIALADSKYWKLYNSYEAEN